MQEKYRKAKIFFTLGILASLLFSIGCAHSKEELASKKEVRKEKRLKQRLAKISFYSQAHKQVEEGIFMMKKANLQINEMDQYQYFSLAIQAFRKAIGLLEKTQPFLDQRDQDIIEKQILQIQKYIKVCLLDRPQVLQSQIKK